MREDRGGVVPDEGPSCNILFKNLRLQRRKTASIQLIIQKIRGWSTQGLWVTTIGHPPPSHLPSVYLTSCTWLFLTGLTPPFLYGTVASSPSGDSIASLANPELWNVVVDNNMIAEFSAWSFLVSIPVTLTFHNLSSHRPKLTVLRVAPMHDTVASLFWSWHHDTRQESMPATLDLLIQALWGDNSSRVIAGSST